MSVSLSSGTPLVEDGQKRMSLGTRIRFLGVAGVGFYSDGYLNIVIGLIVPMIGYIYFEDTKGGVTAIQGDEVKGALSLGMITGQLGFGLFGDILGRHRVYGKELIVTLFGSLMVILLPWKGLSHSGIIAWLAVFRVVTGVGIGGDYPMSASLAAEKSPFGSRAKLVLSVFSFMGLGAFTSSIVYLILIAAFKHAILNDIKRLEWVWRLLLGIGLIPGALTLYARLTMRETKPYEKYVANRAVDEREGHRTFRDQMIDFKVYFRHWAHAKALFGVSASWFLYDIAYYGINLNQSVILGHIGYGKGATPWDTLYNTAVGNIIVQVAGYLPGYYIGIFLADLIGRRRQQLYCCLTVAVLYAIWAGVTNHASTGGLMTLFTLSQLVLNAGPNCTTFLFPVEVFPTRVRGTAHGIAAASGKCGAVLTSFAFGTIQKRIGLNGLLGLFSGIMVLNALATLWIPETRGRSIADIEDDLLYKSSSIVNEPYDQASPQIQVGTEEQKI